MLALFLYIVGNVILFPNSIQNVIWIVSLIVICCDFI
ncbi:hypothetical protein Vpro01_00666 [Vibrio proteolyticus]